MGIVIGITGGIATGKSTVTEMFRERGAEVVSADEIARDVLAPGSRGLALVVEQFGTHVLNPDGSLNRAALADIVFADRTALERINAITHPLIICIMEDRVREFRQRAGGGDVMALEIPLLFECDLRPLVDKVVVVAAEQDTQMNRLTERGISAEEAMGRISAQLPMDQKVAAADWVIRTDTNLSDTQGQAESVWHLIKECAGEFGGR